jgi:hypothetical protein
MRTDTQTVSLDAPLDHVFDFLAEPGNLPTWAVGFARSIRPSGDQWVVATGNGEIGLRLMADRRLGTIDFHMTVAPGVMVIAYSRVVAAGHGTEYVFTQLQSPGMPDGAFDAQIDALREELIVLRSVVKARAACPTA